MTQAMLIFACWPATWSSHAKQRTLQTACIEALPASMLSRLACKSLAAVPRGMHELLLQCNCSSAQPAAPNSIPYDLPLKSGLHRSSLATSSRKACMHCEHKAHHHCPKASWPVHSRHAKLVRCRMRAEEAENGSKQQAQGQSQSGAHHAPRNTGLRTEGRKTDVIQPPRADSTAHAHPQHPPSCRQNSARWSWQHGTCSAALPF